MKRKFYIAALAALTILSCSPLDDSGSWTDGVSVILDWNVVTDSGLRPKGTGAITLTVYPKTEEMTPESYTMDREYITMDLPEGKYAYMAVPEKDEEWLTSTESYDTVELTLKTQQEETGDITITDLPDHQIYIGYTDNARSLQATKTMTDVIMRPALKRLRLNLEVTDTIECRENVSFRLEGITTAMRVYSMTPMDEETGSYTVTALRKKPEKKDGTVRTTYQTTMAMPGVYGANNLFITLRGDSIESGYQTDLTEFLRSSLAEDMTVTLRLDKATGEIDGQTWKKGIEDINIFN